MSGSHLIAVMVGGALGSGARFLVSLSLARYDTFPMGTLSVNILGCFAIGVLATYFGQLTDLSPVLRVGVMVGFLGGFTTFSSFGLDTMKLMEAQRMYSAGLYVIGSNLIGLIAVFGGARLAQSLSQ